MTYGSQVHSSCTSQSVATPVARREPLPALRWQALGPQLAAAASAGGSCSSGGSLAAAHAITSSGGTTNSCDSDGPCSAAAVPFGAGDGVAQCVPEALLSLNLAPALALATPLRQTSEQREQEQAWDDVCMTPRVGRFHFGTPLSSPVSPRVLPAAPTPHASPVCTPSSSAAFYALRCTGPVVPPSPLLLTPSPQAVPSMRPCSVKLSGSVRLVGNQIVALAQPSQRPFLNPALPSMSSESAASGSTTGQAATSWHRELSFAHLLCPEAQRGSTACTSTPPLLAATPTTPLTPFVPGRWAGAAAGILAEMALSPRKRTRKSQAPARAAAEEDSAWAGAGSDHDMHSTPSKIPRHK